MKNAIILCSGGLDSVVTSHYVKKTLGYDNLIILFFNYGQKTIEGERSCAKECAKEINAVFIEISLPFLNDLSSSLINKEGKINELTRKDLKDTKEESVNYYVPMRNTLFLTIALAYAESQFIKTKEISAIFVGFKCEGKESYPDTTKEFVDSFNSFAGVSSSNKFKVIAPLIEKDKEDIILLGKELGVYFTKTFSCYVGKNEHCGVCLACMLRKEGFYWANLQDPTFYEKDLIKK